MIDLTFEPVVDVSVFNRRDITQYFSFKFASDLKLGSLLNNLLSPAFDIPYFERLVGWIGELDYIDNDFFYKVSESTSDREHYQLAPFIISTDDSDNILSSVHYLDIFNNLKNQGSFIGNINRLVKSKNRSWCPPISPDMLINYINYAWSPLGTVIHDIHSETKIDTEIIGQEHYIITLDSTHMEIDEETGEEVEVHDKLELQTGMRFRFFNDVNDARNDIVYLVEGVGLSIQLLDDRNNGDVYIIDSKEELDTLPKIESTKIYNIKDTAEIYKWSDAQNDWVEPEISLEPDYVTISRVSKDNNDWSRSNRWFNISLLNNEYFLYSYYSKKATRQIIQFYGNKKLYNCGTNFLEEVDCYFEGSISELYGKNENDIVPAPNGDNPYMYDGMKILVKDTNSAFEQIYVVSGVSLGMSSVSAEDIVFEDNDEVLVKSGYKKGLYYWNNTKFRVAQTRESNKELYGHTYPLYDLYDSNFVSLNDETIYPNNNFKGSKLFGYKDNVYYTYVNYMYEDLGKKRGYFYDFDKREYQNFLLECKKDIESNYVQYFMVKDPNITQYGLELVGYEISSVYINTKEINASQYIYNPPMIIFNETVTLHENDIIKVLFKYDEEVSDDLQDAFLEVSRVITTSPENKEIEEIAYSVLLSQMVDIISNQDGLIGNPYSQNNFTSTAQDISLGTKLFKSYSRYNKLAIINNMDNVDIRSVITKISEKYEEFKRRFLQRVEQIANTNQFTEDSDIEEVLVNILSYLNLGKLPGDAFYNNGVIGDNCYIPATPAYLGLLPCVKPHLEENGRVLVGHDGSRTELRFKDFRDQALITLEDLIYQSINPEFKNKLGILEYAQYVPGFNKETDYTLDEYNQLMNGFFSKWFFLHPSETLSNLNFSEDPFTWNWSSCKDFTGQPLLGHYRGIYNYFYGTYQPDKCPWEMLGFYEKPYWWDNAYGEAPYTSNNLVMWQDIADGIIKYGENAGQYDYLKRPYLLDIIPTDEDGNLLPPNLNGITSETPYYTNAQKSFKFGDGSDAEYDWWLTSEYQYIKMAVLYLMKPGFWLEYTWDSLSDKEDYTLSNTIHNLEVNGEYQKVIGTAQWVSDYLVLNGISISNLEALLKNVSVKIGYRVGSYLDTGNLNIKNTKEEVLLPTNYKVIQYKSAPLTSISLSTMNIAWVDGKYIIYGNDINNPYFPVFTPDTNANYTYDNDTPLPVFYFKTWNNLGERIQYYTVIDNIQDVYNIIRGYGKYLESVGFIYENYDTNSQTIINWNKMAKNFLNWVNSSEREDRDVLSLTPWNIINLETRYPHSYISFRNEYGIVSNICSYNNNVWNILDIYGDALLSEDVNVYRQPNGVVIETKDMKQVGYLHLSTYSQENAIIFDSIQDNGFIVYDSQNGLYINNLYVESVRTAVWNGGLYAPGLILNSDKLIYNYTKRAYDFKDYYNIDSIASVEPLGLIAKTITGYVPNVLLNNIFTNESAEFDFYNATKYEKGSFNVVKALRRLPSMERLDVFEIFALLRDEYGGFENYKMWEIQAQDDWQLNNPQLFTLHTYKAYKEFLDIVGEPYLVDDVMISADYSENSYTYKGYFQTKNGNTFSPLGFNWKLNIKLSIDILDNEYKTIIYCSDNKIPSLYVKGQKVILCDVIKDEITGEIIEITPILETSTLRLGDAYYIEYGRESSEYYLKWSNDNVQYTTVRTESIEMSNDVENATIIVGASIENGNQILSWNGGKLYLTCYDNSLDENIKEYKKEKINLVYSDSPEWIKQAEFLEDNRFKKISNYSDYTFLPYIPLLKDDEIQYKIITKAEVENLLINNYVSSSDRILVTFDDIDWDLLQLKVVNTIEAIEYDEEVDLYDNTAVFKTVNPHNFFEGQLICINSTRTESEAWDGVQTVLNVIDDHHFTITTTIQSADYFTDGVIPEISSVLSRKYEKPEDLFENNSGILTVKSDVVNPELGDIFYVKNDHVGENYMVDALYRVIDHDRHLELLRQKEDKIDTKLIQQVLVYDSKNPLDYYRYDIYDPYKYQIDLEAQKNINYINHSDPAIYNVNQVTQEESELDNWTNAHIGEVWWDISKIKYFDYELGDDEYRAKMWGKLVYGSEIKVYEWVKSPVAPSDYQSVVDEETEVNGSRLSGSPLYYMVDDTKVYVYNYQSEYDNETKGEKLWYYFWVENTQYVPNVIDRSLSTSAIAMRINEDVNKSYWFAPVSVIQNPDTSYTSSFIMGNGHGIKNSDNVIQIKYQMKENDFPLHKDWVLFHKGLNESKYIQHWNKFKDSLAGYDTHWNVVPNMVLNEYNKFGNRDMPRQSIFTDKQLALKSLIQKINDMLVSKNLDTANVNKFNIQNKLVIEVTEDFLYQPIERNYENFIFKITNDRVNNGNYSFRDYNTYKQINTNNNSNPDFWVFEDARYEEYVTFEYTPVNKLPDFVLNTYVELEALEITEALENGQTIYVKRDETQNYGWSLYVVTSNGFELYTKQLYKMSDYFDFIDWYSPDVDNFNVIVKTYPNEEALRTDDSFSPVNGDLVKILDANQGNWSIVQYNSEYNNWITVANENGTIQINDKIIKLDISDPLSENSKLYALLTRQILTLFED